MIYKDVFNEFNDIYIPVNNIGGAYVQPGMEFVQKGDTDPKFKDLIDVILKRYQDELEAGRDDFSVYFEGDGRRYRCHVNPSIQGHYVNARRMPEDVWELSQCFAKQDEKTGEFLLKYLLNDRLSKGGLVLVCGTPGNGKSTTCSAIVQDRLRKLGGHCNTVEDPVEMPLHGSQGDRGYCIQREIYGKESFAGAVRDTLRGYPTNVNNILLIGEIRDSETAELVIRAAIDGRLVVSTVHAESVVAGVRKLLSYASKSELGKEQAEDLLSVSLRAVIHQDLIGKTGLNLEVMYDTDAVAGALKDGSGNLNQLENEINRQAITISKGEKLLMRNLDSSKKLRVEMRRKFDRAKDKELATPKKKEIKKQNRKPKKKIFGFF